MRNPFPKIGKVIKYDLKHSSKKLLPLYGVLLALGLLTGLCISPARMDNFFAGETISQNTRDWITVSIIIAYYIVACVSSIMTIVVIARRFKQSMLEDEAYLNLSLPVTMGEHLWGKFITGFIWMFVCSIVTSVSALFCFIRLGWVDMFRELGEALPEMIMELQRYNLTIGKIIWMCILMSFAFTCFIITLIFIVNSFGLVIKSRQGFWKFLIIVGLLYINGWIFRLVPNVETRFVTEAAFGNAMMKSCSIFALIMIIISAVYFAVTQYMFTKQLNLD